MSRPPRIANERHVFNLSRPQSHLALVDACEARANKCCPEADKALFRRRANGRISQKARIAGSSTFSTRYCCSITSLTRIAYGSRVFRQGSGRLFSAYQARRAAFTCWSVVLRAARGPRAVSARGPTRGSGRARLPSRASRARLPAHDEQPDPEHDAAEQ